MGDSVYSDKVDILLVDDRQENLIAIEAVIANPEYNLIKIHSGAEALRYLLHNTPVLILMDVQMPELDGLETAATIKSNERTREIPIIFITAINKDEKFVHQGYDYGAVDYIYKPYDPYVLKAKVAVFVEISRQHDRISRLVAVQSATTYALADATDIGHAISNVLKSICTSLGWHLGLFWARDKEDGMISCHAEWHAADYKAQDFIDESLKKRFPLATDVLSQVWENQKPLWIADISSIDHFSRFNGLDRKYLHTMLEVPICIQDETLGMLELYSQRRLSEDPDLVKILGAIGRQIGLVLMRMEAYLDAQVAIRARDEFFSIASHELKNPIMAMKMSVDLIKGTMHGKGDMPMSPEMFSKLLGASSRQADQLTHLVDDLLDVVKIRAGKLGIYHERLNLSDLVQEVTDRYMSVFTAANCQVKTYIQPKVIGQWDRIRLEQVLVNLISNAAKYARGAHIDIEVSCIDDKARLVVQDTGPGIPKDKQEKIFERFEQIISSQSASGLGLGLFIVKQIIDAHHGSVRVESEKGKGSKFIVELPLHYFERRFQEAPANQMRH